MPYRSENQYSKKQSEKIIKQNHKIRKQIKLN